MTHDPRRILIDVDTQRDFMLPEGALYVPTEDPVSTRIRAQLDAATRSGVPILGSVDSHAHDAWEFVANGGPFPPHCVKGHPGWLRVHHDVPSRTRFVPMQTLSPGVTNLVGERVEGEGPRILDADALVAEALAGVGLYFEKEVYSLFSNPVAGPVLDALVHRMGGSAAVIVDVMGYCTGGYCVDAAVEGLLARGLQVRVLAGCTAAIGGADGAARSRAALTAAGARWVEEGGLA